MNPTSKAPFAQTKGKDEHGLLDVPADEMVCLGDSQDPEQETPDTEDFAALSQARGSMRRRPRCAPTREGEVSTCHT